jgi:hypothetical protein
MHKTPLGWLVNMIIYVRFEVSTAVTMMIIIMIIYVFMPSVLFQHCSLTSHHLSAPSSQKNMGSRSLQVEVKQYNCVSMATTPYLITEQENSNMLRSHYKITHNCRGPKFFFYGRRNMERTWLGLQPLQVTAKFFRVFLHKTNKFVFTRILYHYYSNYWDTENDGEADISANYVYPLIMPFVTHKFC